MKSIFALILSGSLLIGVTLGDSTPDNYELPSNATVVNGGPIITGFSCDGLQYGFYADVANGCRLFHVCYPYMDSEGLINTRMWSFICGLETVFNQAALVCDHPEHSIPCEESPDHFDINDAFGREDLLFREDDIV